MQSQGCIQTLAGQGMCSTGRFQGEWTARFASDGVSVAVATRSSGAGLSGIPQGVSCGGNLLRFPDAATMIDPNGGLWRRAG